MFFLLLEKLNNKLRVKVLVECGGGRGRRDQALVFWALSRQTVLAKSSAVSEATWTPTRPCLA